MRKSARSGAELRREPRRDLPRAWRCGPNRVALVVLLGFGAAGWGQTAGATKDALPDAPSFVLGQSVGGDGQAQPDMGAAAVSTARIVLRPCKDSDYVMEKLPLQGPPPCIPENPISPYVTSIHVEPLTSKQKGVLAIRVFAEPFNLVTIVGYSAIAIAENSHSQYGAGVQGIAKLSGYGFAESAQGLFLQTYAIPSLVHQDPRYHRIPTASLKRRAWHAVENTFVTQSDDGRRMPNYASLLSYPIGAELSNLYVPGLRTNAASTAQRVAVGIATDPAAALTAEFLPDVARHIHINIRFIQNILDTMAKGAPIAQ